MTKEAVGFYWTLPVYWADFRELPKDVEAAASRSRTIRYQMERVRRWASENSIRLVDEIVFLDTRVDRATEGCKEALKQATRHLPSASLIYVKFDQDNFWRHNAHIFHFCESIGMEVIDLSPDPITINGEQYDPIQHFKRWREVDRQQKEHLRQNAETGLKECLSRIPDAPGRYTRISAELNERGIKTVTGGLWKPENVRKAIKKIMKQSEAENLE